MNKCIRSFTMQMFGLIVAVILIVVMHSSIAFAQAPTITSFNPTRNALNVEKDTNITVTFDQDMDESTLNNSTIKINGSISGLHTAAFSYNSSSRNLTINPNTDFKVGELVIVTLTRSIISAIGDSLDKVHNWSFTIKTNGGSGQFTQNSIFDIGSRPGSVFSGDFDGDGDVDLAVANPDANKISFFLNDGSGIFTLISSTGVGNYPNSIRSGDLDGDGNIDLAVTNGISDDVSILMNNGIGTFTLSSSIVVGDNPNSITTGDLDGDGDVDLAVATTGSNTISIILNDGSGTLSLSDSLVVFNSPYSITSGDLDGDGDVDLAVTNLGRYTVTILLNDGLGVFQNSSSIDAGMSLGLVTSGDFNGDGNVDLMVGTHKPYQIEKIFIFLNNGSGIFTLRYSTIVGPFINFPLSAGDVDGDGDIDIAYGGGEWGGMGGATILLNNGRGTFTTGFSTGIGIRASSITAGDLDGDGDIDLALTHGSSNTGSILINQNAAANAPTGLVATAGNGEITLKWNKNTEPDFLRYRIYRSTSSPASTLIDSTNSILDTVKLITGLTNGVTYYFRITAVDSAYNESGYSNEVSAVPSEYSVPVIVSFAPTLGPVGTTVTITGNNFSTTPASNIVYFGAVRANVLSSNSTSITVTAPTGATYAPITVTVGRLTGYSAAPFVITFPGGSALSSSSFIAKVDFSTGALPYMAAAGDFDGDGKPDIAAINGTVVSVYRNTCNPGSITSSSFAPKLDFTLGSNDPECIATGDLNGDGKLDLVITNYAGNSISVLCNTSSSGNISFATKVDLAVGINPYNVVISDLDGDGKSDLVLTNTHSNKFSVFQNKCTSDSITNDSFAPRIDFTTSILPVGVAVGDLDGDGKPDIAVANGTSNSVSVFRNISTRGIITSSSFSAKVDFTAGDGPHCVVIGDLDLDNKIDIVVTNYWGNTVSIFGNTSTSGSITSSSFAAKVDFSTGINPRWASIYDMDGDGKPDIATANCESNTISLFKNTSIIGSITSSSFVAKVDFTTGSFPAYPALGDIDGDGLPDLSVANRNSNTISVLRNISNNNSIILSQGWNLISVPRVQSDWNASTIFPGKYGAIFGYSQVLSDYVEAPILDVGLGYWVYYTDATIIVISGDVADTVKISCKAGWNLIGSREREVQVSDLQLSAGSIYGSAFYYNTGIGDYAETAVIAPGQGIWIYVTQDCELTIP